VAKQPYVIQGLQAQKQVSLISGKFWTTSCYDVSRRLLAYFDVGLVVLEIFVGAKAKTPPFARSLR
jgi:hypothetical protein